MNNPIVRKGFIAALLKADPETIAETTLLPTILHQDYPDDKLGILDVRVLMENGTQIDMEMQVAYFEYWDARVLFYLSRIFTDQLRKGESYENLKKCIHVSILDFIHFKEDDKCHRTICFCDEKNRQKIYRFNGNTDSGTQKTAGKSEKRQRYSELDAFPRREKPEGSLRPWQKQTHISMKPTRNWKKLSADERAKAGV